MKRKDLVEQFFSHVLFAPNRMDELLRLFNTTKASSGLKEEPDKPRPETNLQTMSLGSFLNDNQLSLIAHCANEAQLLQPLWMWKYCVLFWKAHCIDR